MLVAYGPGNQPVIAEDTSPEELHHWSYEHVLHCPNCRGLVHVRGGPDKRTQLHFAHQKGECAWSTESESVRHMRGKLLLSQWVRRQFPAAVVSLEERLPEPNRIADVFVRHADGRCWAIEFQCAPLDIDEWRHRHTAYRKAGIIDLWIIGANRREKQEAFLEAVLTTGQDILFLDPLCSPPRVWLRWPVPRREAQFWQETDTHQPTAITPAGWVGRAGYGMTVNSELDAISLDSNARLVHPAKVARERRLHLLQAMGSVPLPDTTQIAAYFAQDVDEKMLHRVLIPLVKAYLHDPELLQRYNYGRGHPGQPVSPADKARVLRAHSWLLDLEEQGFSAESIAKLFKELPYVGAYAALATYGEMLLALPRQAS